MANSIMVEWYKINLSGYHLSECGFEHTFKEMLSEASLSYCADFDEANINNETHPQTHALSRFLNHIRSTLYQYLLNVIHRVLTVHKGFVFLVRF